LAAVRSQPHGAPLLRRGDDAFLKGGLQSDARRCLLDDVRETKIKMFFSAGDKLAEAKRGAIRLAPQPALRQFVRADYDAMAGMMFHDPPSFKWIMEEIEAADDEINKASSAEPLARKRT
jgi:hypothetical protein